MVEVSIFLIGAIIFVGFFSLYFFERTKIPDVLLLMLLGVLLGPVFKVVDPAFLIQLAPFFGALALIIILFDGGLNLNIFKVLGELAPATLFTLAAFLASMIAVGAVSLVFGWNILQGLLLGAVLGGTARNIVIPLMLKINAGESVKTLLSLESALNDALTIVAAITLTQVTAAHTLNIQNVSNSLLGAFSIAAVVGIVVGLAWLRIMTAFHEKTFGYMLTLATLFILYAVVESVKASGAIAVLVFGLIMGSATQLQQLIDRRQKPLRFEGPLKAFHTELSFFVRTFFFVYMGVMLNLNAFSASVAVVSVVVFIILWVARYAVVEWFTRFVHALRQYKTLMVTMMPKGLAAAVLASYPAAQGVKIPGFEEIVFAVLILTNILATAGVFYYEQTSTQAKPRIVKWK